MVYLFPEPSQSGTAGGSHRKSKAKHFNAVPFTNDISSILRAIPVERQDIVGRRGIGSAVQCNTINVSLRDDTSAVARSWVQKG